MTEPAPLQQVYRTYVLFRGRRLSYFSGCDYFRLSSHPRILRALHEGADKFGLNVAASRMTTGNHKLYGDLERALAKFFDVDDALLLPNGYSTNLAVAQALRGNFSHALIDEHAHPTLTDASHFLDCPVLKFAHVDTDALAAAVRRCGPGSKLILLTDGLFARDGHVAPLADYQRVLPRDAQLLIDDAHGAGILGRRGRGTLEHCGVDSRRIIRTITLSKAFGAFGGAILATKAVRRQVLARSNLFTGSTPLPLPLAAAALEAVQLLGSDRSFQRRLDQNTLHAKTALRQAGMPLPPAPGPILPFVVKTPSAATRLRNSLQKAGIFPPLIKYPGAPANGFFRFVISSEHTTKQLGTLIDSLTRAADSLAPL